MAWVPEACTLPTAEQPVRVAEFDELFRRALVEVARDGEGRAVLTLRGGAAALETVRDLTARETACCSFFAFEVTADEELVRLAVAVPPGQVAALHGLVARAEAALAARR